MINRNRLLKILGVVFGAIITAFGVRYLVLTSFVSVKLADDSGSYTLIVSDVNNGQTISVGDYSSGQKIKVNRGEYAVSVLHDSDSSYYKTFKSSGFMKTTEITPELKPLASFTGIGSGAENCAGVVSNILYSYPCNSSLGALRRHTVGTNTAPSYKIIPVFDSSDYFSEESVVEGLQSIDSGSYILLKVFEGLSSTSVHKLYKVSENSSGVLELMFIDKLDFLSSDGLYTLKSLGNSRLLTYDPSDVRRIFAFEPSSKPLAPETMNIPSTLTNLDSLADISTHKSTISISVYPNIGEEGSNTDEVEFIFGSKSSDFKRKLFNMKGPFKAAVCEDNGAYYCIEGDTYIDIQNTSSEVHEPSSVKATEKGMKSKTFLGSKVIFSNETGIIVYDTSTFSGYYSYVFSEQEDISNLQTLNDNEFLFTANSGKQNDTVYKMNTSGSGKSISPFIDDINESNFIEKYSIYDKNIYLTPDLGDVEYSENTNDYRYSETKKTEVNKLINDLKAKHKDTLEGYTIINTLAS